MEHTGSSLLARQFRQIINEGSGFDCAGNNVGVAPILRYKENAVEALIVVRHRMEDFAAAGAQRPAHSTHTGSRKRKRSVLRMGILLLMVVSDGSKLLIVTVWREQPALLRCFCEYRKKPPAGQIRQAAVLRGDYSATASAAEPSRAACIMVR